MTALSTAELETMYDHVAFFPDELRPVQKGSEWFHVRPDGTPAYESRFEGAGRFRGKGEERTASVIRNGKLCSIDVNGVIVRTYPEFDCLG